MPVESAAPLTVRALETDGEFDAFYRLAVEEFSQAEDIDGAARSFRLAHETGPDFHPGQRRGAFLGTTLAGGYLMLERWLVMGPARIRTACVGSVVTHPNYRRRGIATAMMNDAEAHARYRGHALLLLNGIPNFYPRLGYADVFDVARHSIRRWSIPRQDNLPPVRPATLDDAPALLALYRRHYGDYHGSFMRTLGYQRHHLAFQIDRGIAPLVVEMSGSRLDGYLQPAPVEDRAHAREVAADSWPAALALLRAHQELAGDPRELWWPLPVTAPTLHLLAGNLATPSRRSREPIAFPLRTTINVDPGAGWMARPGHLSLLFHQLVPLWSHCWEHRGVPHSISFTLIVDDEPYSLQLDGATVRISEQQIADGPTAVLSSSVFTQMVFGYRPASWAAAQPDQHIPDDLREPLDILFPCGATWIPGSDVF